MLSTEMSFSKDKNIVMKQSTMYSKTSDCTVSPTYLIDEADLIDNLKTRTEGMWTIDLYWISTIKVNY